MRRFALLLVLAGGLYWTWSTGLLAEWLTPPAQAASEGISTGPRVAPGNGSTGETAAQLQDDLGSPSAAELDFAEGEVPGGGDGASAGSLRIPGLQSLGALGQLTPEQFADAVAAGRPEALEAAFQVARKLKQAGPDHEAAAEAIAAAATRFAASTDLDLAVVALGEGNSFLHTTEGRQLAETLVGRIRQEPADRAVKLYTAVLERCMRGDLRPEDSEARGLVDRIYRAHQIPVRNHLCNPSNLARAKSYVVQRGDALSRICSRARSEDNIMLSPDLLAALNRIHNASMLRIGQRLKIPRDPVVTVVEKRSYLMALYVGDVIFRLYRIGHGADGLTPVAEFTVSTKLENPDWYAPDRNVYPHGHPKNILGGFFVKLENDYYQGFGVHGTPHQESIGKMGSAGCVRMLDADIRDYFQLVPRGTKLIVRDSRG